MGTTLSRERLEFLAELSLLLNSSLSPAVLIETTLRYLRGQLQASSVSLYLGSTVSSPVPFRRLEIESLEFIQGQIVPRTDNPLLESVLKTGVEVTEGTLAICSPLLARGTKPVGAIEVRRGDQGGAFVQEDIEYVKQFCAQLALALENANLFQKLQRSRKQLAELNQRKMDVLTVLNHELQTPLTVFQTSVELLSSPAISEDQRIKIKDTLGKGLRRLSTIARELQNVSRTAAGDFEVVTTPVSLNEVFTVLRAQFEGPTADRQIALTLEDADEVVVTADQTLLLVALNNLLSNAIRFTPDGGSITVRTCVQGGSVEVEVEDTGIGIEESHRDAIFEKFYEVGDAAHHSTGNYAFKSGGLGLGLATVKGIIEAHGSTIRVKSQVGVGSVFSFSLMRSS